MIARNPLGRFGDEPQEITCFEMRGLGSDARFPGTLSVTFPDGRKWECDISNPRYVEPDMVIEIQGPPE